MIVFDEMKGFCYFEGWVIIGFIDGMEVLVVEDVVDYVLVGDEDFQFINGFYVFVQKW